MLAAAAAAALLTPVLVDAGILGTYTFTGADPAGDNQTPNGNGTAATQLTFGSFTRTGLTSGSLANAFRSTAYATGATIDTAEYAQFNVTVNPGYALELTQITATYDRANGNGGSRGPRQVGVRSSFESYAAGSGTGSTLTLPNGATTGTWNFNDHLSASGGTASFRFYGWDAGSGELDIDNVTLEGDVVALARMQAAAVADPAGPVIVGATAEADVTVENTATGGTKQQGLNFNVSGNGDLSGGGGNSNLPPGGPQVVTLTIDTSAAGARGGNVTVTSNASSTNGNVGQSTYNQAVSVNVLDHSNASFESPADDDEITVDFGTVVQGSSQSTSRTIFNLVATAAFTAGLDLDSLLETDPDGVFSTDLATFTNLSAGGSQVFLLSLDTATLGTFSGSYTLAFSDQDLPGATGGQSLTINLLGNVVAVPEPASVGLLLGAALLLTRRRRA
jgi:hypothetical protein